MRLKAAARGGSCAISTTIQHVEGRSYDQALEYSVAIHKPDYSGILALKCSADLGAAVAAVREAADAFFMLRQDAAA